MIRKKYPDEEKLLEEIFNCDPNSEKYNNLKKKLFILIGKNNYKEKRIKGNQ